MCLADVDLDSAKRRSLTKSVINGRCIRVHGVKSSSMPRAEREYREHRFEADTVRAAYMLFKRCVAGKVPEERRSTIVADGVMRRFNEASEFLAAYSSDVEQAELAVIYKASSFLFSMVDSETHVEIGLPDRADVRDVLETFDSAARHWSVFLGHGRDPVWSRLADHLASVTDFTIRTYENSVIAGVTAIELLEQLGAEVDFAVLVHTCDTEPGQDGGSPSPNVIHETGFFQGKLGRHRTVVVRERGCPAFHNIAGIHEVTFEADAIEVTHEQVEDLIRSVVPKG